MTDWSQVPLTELADHIEKEHHSYLREALPRLSGMLEQLARADLIDVFSALRSELEAHLFKEEQVLFPMIRDLEASATLPDFHCGTLRNPVRVMESEHDDAQGALSRLRELTHDFEPPENASDLYRATVKELGAFDADMQQHIYKESSVLFPRAVADESAKPR